MVKNKQGSIQKTKGSVFVAYSYSLYNKKDFRRIFNELQKEFKVSFIFADESFTKQQVFAKIKAQILGADFSLFDVTDWNPNVTLELGLAEGLEKDYYISFNPARARELGRGSEVPSDIRGIDRIQYEGLEEFKDHLRLLFNQKFRTQPRSISDYEEEITNLIIDALKKNKERGISVDELKNALNIDSPIIRATLAKLGDRISHNSGATRSRRYSYKPRPYNKRK